MNTPPNDVTFLTVARKLPGEPRKAAERNRRDEPSSNLSAVINRSAGTRTQHTRARGVRAVTSRRELGGKLNNTSDDRDRERSRERGATKAKMKAGGRKKRKRKNARRSRWLTARGEVRVPHYRRIGLPPSVPRARCPSLPVPGPLTYGQVSSESVWRAGYHYVYSLELKCHIMTQLGGPYNLCP